MSSTSGRGVRPGFGCVGLILLAVTAVWLPLDLIFGRPLRRTLEKAEPGWVDSARARYRIPDLSGLLVPATTPGDAAVLLRDSLVWTLTYPEEAFRAVIGLKRAERPDSLMWDRIRAASDPDRFARAATMADWGSTELMIRRAGARDSLNLLALDGFSYRHERSATRGLVIRGILRLRARDSRGARDDLAAATTIGYRLARHEPTRRGFEVGRSAIGAAMEGWSELATATRDDALRSRVEAIARWAVDSSESLERTFAAAPDSALSLAADSTVALGMRATALQSALAGWLIRPRGFLIGPPEAFIEALRTHASSADRDYAMLADIALRNANRMNAVTSIALLWAGR